MGMGAVGDEMDATGRVSVRCDGCSRLTADCASVLPAREFGLVLVGLTTLCYELQHEGDAMQLCGRRGRVPGQVRLQHTTARHYSTVQREGERTGKEEGKAPFESDSEWSIAARHALRAILRECSYLPDQHARRYLSQYAISRFRVYSFKAWKRRDDEVFEERLRSKHDEARKALRQLRRANEGERKPLLKALLMTYGRIGKRRRELLLPLLPQAATEHQEDEGGKYNSMGMSLVDFFRHGPGNTSATNASTGRTAKTVQAVSSDHTAPSSSQLLPALYALALSQTRANVPQLTRVNPKKLRPDVPRLDSKMRPLAACRVKNITKKWYADFIDRILPPLPAEEWHRIHRLALGRGIPAPLWHRRRLRPSDDSSLEEQSAALETVISRPKGLVKKRMLVNTEAHTVTPRYLQRLYAQVFSQCPLMEWDGRREKWDVTWGCLALHSRIAARAPTEATSTVSTTQNVGHIGISPPAPLAFSHTASL